MNGTITEDKPKKIGKKGKRGLIPIITAIKDNVSYYGTIPAIADKIGYNPESIRRWYRSKISYAVKNGFEIYLKSENVKLKRK